MVQTPTAAQVEHAIAVLKKGGIVVFPTETAYGLAADATQPEAVARVFALKQRLLDKTVPMIAADVEMVEQYAGISRGLRRLANVHWPGPLTLVLPVMGDELAPGVVRNDTVAVRVSSHPVAQALSKGLGAPIVSTSANLSGQPTCYTIEAVRAQLEDAPDVYLDHGPLDPSVLPSTIVGIDDYGYPDVLRQGDIEIDV